MFRAFIKSLSEDKSPTVILIDNLQKLLGLLAVIVGAIWFVKEFYEFQKRNEEWTLKQQELTAKQTELSNKQLELTLQQSNVVKEQLQIGLESSKLDIESKKLAIKSATHNNAAAEDTRYSFSQTYDFASIHDYNDGTKLFAVTMEVDVKNTYDQTLQVDGCLFSTFFARLPSIRAGPKHALAIPSPPSAIEAPREGPITWELVRSHAFTSYKKDDKSFVTLSRYYSSEETDIATGGCTGEISPGDTLEYAEYHIIRARPTDMMGFSVDVDIRGIGWRWRSASSLLSPKSPSERATTKSP